MRVPRFANATAPTRRSVAPATERSRASRPLQLGVPPPHESKSFDPRRRLPPFSPAAGKAHRSRPAEGDRQPPRQSPSTRATAWSPKHSPAPRGREHKCDSASGEDGARTADRRRVPCAAESDCSFGPTAVTRRAGSGIQNAAPSHGKQWPGAVIGSAERAASAAICYAARSARPRRSSLGRARGRRRRA